MGVAARQRKFEIRVFLLLDGRPSQADEHKPPEAEVLRRQFHAFHPFSHRSKRFHQVQKLSPTRRPGVGCQRLLETHKKGLGVGHGCQRMLGTREKARSWRHTRRLGVGDTRESWTIEKARSWLLGAIGDTREG